MSHIIHCDRCGEEERADATDDIEHYLPDGWNIADGCHLCHECDRAFQAFIGGKAVPALSQTSQGAAMNPPETQQWMKDARDFRQKWSHKPTPIPAEQQTAQLWYSEECVDQLLVGFLAAHAPQQWIPVSERLPAIGQAVLFYVAYECWIEMGFIHDTGDNRDDFWECERTAPQDEPIQFAVRDERVTHWMPLPAPPVPATPCEQTEKK